METTANSSLNGSLVETIEHVVSAALAAPSMLNTQPWQFKLRLDGVLEMWVAWDRLLPVSDPNGRALYLATGAAVHNMRLASHRFRREPVVHMRPEPGTPSLLARFHLGAPVETTLEARILYEAIWRRHTNRFPFQDTPIPPEVTARLSAAARSEGAELHPLSPQETTNVLRLIRQANHTMESDDLYRKELAYWTTWRRDRRDGVPCCTFGRLSDDGQLPMRDFGIALPGSNPTTEGFESTPALFALSSQGDQPDDWLRAGEALQRVLLVATAHGLSASFFYQPFQFAESRARLRLEVRTTAHPQMILRIGHGPVVAGPPRRHVGDALTVIR